MAGITAAIISGITSAVAAAGAAVGAAAGAIGGALGAAGAAIGSGVGATAAAVGLTAGELVSIVGAGVSATVSGVQGAQQADMQEATAAYNSRLMENQGIELQNANVRKKADSRMIMSQQLSNQQAIAAAKGVSLESDSSLSLFDNTVIQNQFQEERLDYNSNQKVSSLNQGAQLARYEGNARAANSRIGAAGSIISGGARVASKWYKATA